MKQIMIKWPITLIICGIFLFGCDQDNSQLKKKTKRPAHNVEVAIASVEEIAIERLFTGTVEAPRSVRVYNQETGRILYLPYYEGDRVTKGTTVVQLDDDLIQAEYDKASATLNQARIDLKRIQKLIPNNLASDEELERAQTAVELARAEQQLLKIRLSRTVITAPFDAVISERHIEPGDVVPLHSHILTLIDPSHLIVKVSVSDNILSSIKKDTPVNIAIAALADITIKGRVHRIYPTIDPDTRQGMIEIKLIDADPRIKPGQLCRVKLQSEKRQRLLIPVTALRHDASGSFVYHVDNENKTRIQAVITGYQYNDKIMIVDGLKAGQQVITKGFLGLRKGKKVSIVNRPTDKEKTLTDG